MGTSHHSPSPTDIDSPFSSSHRSIVFFFLFLFLTKIKDKMKVFFLCAIFCVVSQLEAKLVHTGNETEVASSVGEDLVAQDSRLGRQPRFFWSEGRRSSIVDVLFGAYLYRKYKQYKDNKKKVVHYHEYHH